MIHSPFQNKIFFEPPEYTACAVVACDDVGDISIAWPPRNKASRRVNALGRCGTTKCAQVPSRWIAPMKPPKIA